MTKKHRRAKRRTIVNVFGSKLQFFIRLFSWTLLLVLATSVISLHLRLWPLEIYASYIPQLFLLSITLYILLTALYGRFIVRDGWATCWKFIGWNDGIIFLLSGIFTVYIAVYSSNIIRPVPSNSINYNLTVGTYNVLYTNPDIYQAAYYFKSNDADIVALQEASPEFIEQARQILGFDYVQKTDCDCSAEDTEIAVLSRYPLSNTSSIFENQNGAILRTEAEIDSDTSVAVYAVHIPPPMTQSWYSLRNQQIANLSDKIHQEKLKPIIMGDFNTTIYSPVMSGFIDDNKFKIDNISDKSWPKCSWFGYGSALCARIDHIFVSRQFGIGQRHIGPGYGSDHRPLVAELLVN